MRSESDPRSRIAWQPETPMIKALWENGSLHEAIISMTGPKSLEGHPSGIKARAGIVSILGMLIERGEPSQAIFGGHRRGPTSPRSRGDRSASTVLARAPRAVRGFSRSDRRAQDGGGRGRSIGIIAGRIGNIWIEWRPVGSMCVRLFSYISVGRRDAQRPHRAQRVEVLRDPASG